MSQLTKDVIMGFKLALDEGRHIPTTTGEERQFIVAWEELNELRKQVEKLTEESVVLRASSRSKLETISSLELQNILMKFDPATGEERPYPSHAAQWREWHGGTAWLFDPWTGRRRDARDVGSDVHGLLIVPAGTLGMDMGGGCSEKDNVACA